MNLMQKKYYEEELSLAWENGRNLVRVLRFEGAEVSFFRDKLRDSLLQRRERIVVKKRSSYWLKDISESH